MSTFEIELPEDPKFAENLADQIVSFMNNRSVEEKPLTAQDLIAGVKPLQSLDALLAAVQNAYNDAAMVVNQIADNDVENASKTRDGLDEAFLNFTGRSCDEYSVTADAGIGGEPDDDDEEEETEAVPGDVV